MQAAALMKSLFPDTEVSRHLQASFCDLVHLKTDLLMTRFIYYVIQIYQIILIKLIEFGTVVANVVCNTQNIIIIVVHVTNT